jgi:predicted nucleic acid-binding protein
VIQEFFVAATRKLAIEPLKAKAIVATFHPLELVTVSLDDITDAIDGHILWQISFWDALILRAAERARARSGRVSTTTAARGRGVRAAPAAK